MRCDVLTIGTELLLGQIVDTNSSWSGEPAVIMSRSLRTWGTSEAALGEMLAERFDTSTNPTIAFLARGIEGLYVRMTAKAPTDEEATALLDEEEKKLRTILGQLVFGVDDETMEHAVLAEPSGELGAPAAGPILARRHERDDSCVLRDER